jgi:predicted lipoprotein with Yx(FWY)xxD motif
MAFALPGKRPGGIIVSTIQTDAEIPMQFSASVLALLIGCCPIAAAAADTASPNLQHPGNTAATQLPDGKWRIVSFPGMGRLYVYDKDGPEKSNCNSGCDSAWPPLLVPEDHTGQRLGDWTVIVRTDGRRQWACKGHPVYLRFHDIEPDADTAREGFHLLEP